MAKTAKMKTAAEKRFEKLYSVKNLQLAWDRINAYIGDISYKNLYRNLYAYYDHNIESNLQQLSERIKNRTYKPSKAFKFYKPKESGLQRMFSLLDIEDMIVYQALANIVIPGFSRKRKHLERKNVFSHLFCNDINSNIFLFEKWKDGYLAYKQNIAKNFNNGLKFTAHFDLAAYYDTIDHNSLLNNFIQEQEEDVENGIRALLNECLERWSNDSEDALKMHHHGIPQGPISSAVFGELFLYPVDKFLVDQEIVFSRYVDDFVIQGKTLENVQSAVILLEKKCKERGLIPQVGKFEIIESSSAEDAIGKAPSLSSQERDELLSSPDDVLGALNRSFQKDTFDSSKIRYILKVYQDTPILQDVVFREFRNHYEFATEFCIYLRRFLHNQLDQIYPFVKYQIQQVIPYEYVEYELWSLLADINRMENCSQEKKKARKRLISCQTIVRLGVYSYLSTFDKESFLSFLMHEGNALILMHTIPLIDSSIVDSDYFNEFLSFCAKRSSLTLKKVLSSHLCYMRLFRDITQERLDECLKYLPKIEEQDYKTINFYFKTDFDIKCKIDWECFFGAAHQQASLLLYHAHMTMKKNNTFWLNCVDSFNDLMIRAFIGKLKNENDHVTLPELFKPDGELIEYGNLINLNSKFCKKYKVLVNAFHEIHDRRCSTPLSHPLNNKTGKYATFVSSSEAVEFKKKEISGLTEIMKRLNCCK